MVYLQSHSKCVVQQFFPMVAYHMYQFSFDTYKKNHHFTSISFISFSLNIIRIGLPTNWQFHPISLFFIKFEDVVCFSSLQSDGDPICFFWRSKTKTKRRKIVIQMKLLIFNKIDNLWRAGKQTTLLTQQNVSFGLHTWKIFNGHYI